MFNTYHHLRGDKMKVRDIAMIGAGMAAVILYQKYGSQLIEDAYCLMNKEIKMIKDEINQMM